MVILLAVLCFVTMAVPADAQDQTSPLWQKIEDARVYMSSNKFPESRAMFEQALEMAIREKDQAAEAICIGNLGTLCDMTDQIDDAIKYYKKGYELAEREHNNVLLSKFTGCLVRKYAQKSDMRQARKWLDIQESIPVPDDPAAKFYTMYDKASVLFLENDPVLALHYLDKAWRYAEEHDLGSSLTGAALMGAGDILYKLKRYGEAIETYQQGLATLRKGGNRAQEVFALRSLYVAYKQVGDSVRAAKYKEEYSAATDSMYDGMVSEPVDNRLKNFEEQQNTGLKETGKYQYFFLICVLVVLLGIVAFVAVALHRLSSRQKRLLDAGAVIRMSSADEKTPAPSKPASETVGASEPDTEEKASDQNPDRETQGTPMLTYDQQKTLLEKINLVMENVSLISREDFNLAMLAKAVNSNTKYVSKVINDMCGKTFKTYLNEYRIREACRRLIDKENFGHLTIKAIHQELGFRTTTSFVAAFRKVMGMTPSEYKRLHGNPSDADEESDPDAKMDDTAGVEPGE